MKFPKMLFMLTIIILKTIIIFLFMEMNTGMVIKVRNQVDIIVENKVETGEY